MKRPDILNYKHGPLSARLHYFDDLEKYATNIENVLKELIDLNSIRNDLEAYQYHLCQFGLGNGNKPKREDFGLPTDR